MSNFKWKDLIKINSANDAYMSPLACIAHIDVNAFFAQAEQIRCNYTKDDPVVCVQWKSLIAVSYAAKKFGISRMDTIESAMEKCPDLIPVHTAVFKKGEDFWQYYDGYGSWNKDKSKHLSAELYKVSLDPYRRESRKVLRIFKEYCDLVEKASVDEAFLDLGRLVFQILFLNDNSTSESNKISFNDKMTNGLSIFQEIRDLFVSGRYNLDSYLPKVTDQIKEAFTFQGNIYRSEDEDSQRPDIEDWDDVIFSLASHLTHTIRNDIQETLGYTTSCGIARTKTLAKLGSGYQKPNAQTVILNKYINSFLDCGKFEITSFWTLGGKLGVYLQTLLNLPSTGSNKYIREKWDNPRELQDFIDAEIKHTNFIPDHNKSDFERTNLLAKKIFELVRGEHISSLNPRPVVKSMMSNKNMRGNACANYYDIVSWFEIFASELNSRVKELQQEYDKLLLPKTVTVFMRVKSGESYRRSGPLLFSGNGVTHAEILKAASKLAQEIDNKYAKGRVLTFYPLINLNVTLNNFEISDQKTSIINMFGKKVSVTKKTLETNSNMNIDNSNYEDDFELEQDTTKNEIFALDTPPSERETPPQNDTHLEQYLCEICKTSIENEKEFNEHMDYHVALKLSESLNGVTEESQNLSVGERRLLFGKKAKIQPIAPSKFTPKRSPKFKKATRNSNAGGNILKYFNRTDKGN